MNDLVKILAAAAVVCWIGYVFSFGSAPWERDWLPSSLRSSATPAAGHEGADALDSLQARLEGVGRNDTARSESLARSVQPQRALAPVYQSKNRTPAGTLPDVANQTPPIVELYVAGWDRYSQDLEKALKRSKVKYVRMDVDRNPSLRTRMAKYGGTGIPFAIVGETGISGNKPAEIVLALQAELKRRNKRRF